MDTWLRCTHPSFECQRTEIAQTLMEPLAVVEAFNKRKDVATRFVPAVVRLVMRELVFQRTEKLSATALS